MMVDTCEIMFSLGILYLGEVSFPLTVAANDVFILLVFANFNAHS
jgi:hypothetical protein